MGPIVAEEPIVAEKPVVAAEPVAVETPVVAEKPVAAEEPVVAEKPVVAEEPVVAEKPAETPSVETVAEEVVVDKATEKLPETPVPEKFKGHLDCLKNAKWAPAQLLDCGKKIVDCLSTMVLQW